MQLSKPTFAHFEVDHLSRNPAPRRRPVVNEYKEICDLFQFEQNNQKLLVVIEWWIISFVFLHNMVATVQVAGGEIFYNLALTGLDHFFYYFQLVFESLVSWHGLRHITIQSALSKGDVTREDATTIFRPHSVVRQCWNNVATVRNNVATML